MSKYTRSVKTISKLLLHAKDLRLHRKCMPRLNLQAQAFHKGQASCSHKYKSRSESDITFSASLHSKGQSVRRIAFISFVISWLSELFVFGVASLH